MESEVKSVGSLPRDSKMELTNMTHCVGCRLLIMGRSPTGVIIGDQSDKDLVTMLCGDCIDKAHYMIQKTRGYFARINKEGE